MSCRVSGFQGFRVSSFAFAFSQCRCLSGVEGRGCFQRALRQGGSVQASTERVPMLFGEAGEEGCFAFCVSFVLRSSSVGGAFGCC